MLVSVSSRSGSFSRPILALVKTLWNKNKTFTFPFYLAMTMFHVFSRPRLLTAAAGCLDIRLAVQCSWCAVCTMPSCGHVSLPSCCHATKGFHLYYGSHVTKVDIRHMSRNPPTSKIQSWMFLMQNWIWPTKEFCCMLKISLVCLFSSYSIEKWQFLSQWNDFPIDDTTKQGYARMVEEGRFWLSDELARAPVTEPGICLR